MDLGEKIAGLRKKNNMTQAELGDALSVTYQAVSKWERGESQPDFDTMSRMAKLFGVSLSYFEDGGEQEPQSEPAPTVGSAMLGMCVRCGKVVYDGDAAETEPRLVCKACAELDAQAERQRVIDKEKAEAAKEQQKKEGIAYRKAALKKRRNLALLISVIPAVAIFVTFLVLSLLPDNKPMFPFIFGVGCVLAVMGYTFTSQMIWDGTVREVCTGGGHVMSLPGIIFSLSPDGLIFLIVTKIFLAFISALVFVGSIIACVFAAIIISPVTFVPSLLLYNRKIRKVS